jgi:hypothetical protein
MSADITILYQGGSGGFLLFYYLLLSGNYHTGLQYQSVQSLIDQQFTPDLVTQPNQWKTREFWPDNLHCKKQSLSPRLFLICNPCWPGMTEQNQFVSQHTQRYLLWTDIHTQLRMAYEKKAYWFTDVSRQHFNAPAKDGEYIKHILQSALDQQDPKIAEIKKLFCPQHTIQLQEFLQTRQLPGQPTASEHQNQFTDYWLSLQPPKVRHLLTK